MPCDSAIEFFKAIIKGVFVVGLVAPDIVLSTVMELVSIVVITPARAGELVNSFK
jgi:hypothetical protein